MALHGHYHLVGALVTQDMVMVIQAMDGVIQVMVADIIHRTTVAAGVAVAVTTPVILRILFTQEILTIIVTEEEQLQVRQVLQEV